MFGRRKKEIEPEINLLELVPERIVQSETGDDGIVTVLGPRFKSVFMKRLVSSRLKNPYFKVKLDEIGTTVWDNIDGERNIGEIAEILKEKFGESIEPCNDRLAIFFSQLELSRYIRYRNVEEVRQQREK
jgi:hypothetical protein